MTLTPTAHQIIDISLRQFRQKFRAIAGIWFNKGDKEGFLDLFIAALEDLKKFLDDFILVMIRWKKENEGT
jgi:hypothetical protein